MPDLPISGLSSADPASTALVVLVVNATTVRSELQEAVGYWSTAAGDIVYANAARSLTRLADPGASGAVLVRSSAAAAPAWLALGSSGTFLHSTGGMPTWSSVTVSSVTEIGCGLRHSAAQSNASTPFGLLFDTELWDTDGMHSTVSNSSLVTIRTAGTYIITANVGFSTALGSGKNSIRILANSSVIARGWTYSLSGSAADDPLISPGSVSLSAIQQFSSGATIVVQVVTDVASSNTISTATPAAPGAVLSLTKIA